ncbi:MAG: prepilin-type N-terminal cleavage/methylation domain-containing protein [Phycisphaerae bacterium]
MSSPPESFLHPPDRVVGPTRAARPIRAFTLVELVVVIAIMVVVISMTVPAVTSLWGQRKLSEAENTIRGLLVTTRALALQTGGVDSGLFFFVDRNGTQRVRSIVQAKPGDIVWRDVFAISQDRGLSMPAPFRVVPRYVVDEERVDNQPFAFGADELANERFVDPDPSLNPEIGQRHRNFFAVVFSGDGQLRLRRNVLIQDHDTVDDNVPQGDITGLRVGGASDPMVDRFWSQDGDAGNNGTEPLDLLRLRRGAPDLVSDPEGIAINFPSVDGLIVYDDDVFTQSGFGDSSDEQKRDYLLRSGQPFYVNRWTGAVTRGPVGEVAPP